MLDEKGKKEGRKKKKNGMEWNEEKGIEGGWGGRSRCSDLSGKIDASLPGRWGVRVERETGSGVRRSLVEC